MGVTRAETFETERMGTLSFRSQFKFQLAGEGGTWGVFRFHEHVTAPKGEWVSCYGGDPDPKGRRQWHSFHADAVRTEARPPGRLAMKEMRTDG